MSYDLFLFDLDDTLLDFRESEKLSFARTLQSFGLHDADESLFQQYQRENRLLWTEFEKGLITKDHLKVERFHRIFSSHGIDLDPQVASARYLEALPESVVLIDYAVEICETLASRGEIGIVTNGIHSVQTQRLKKSNLAPFISFVAVSEVCGFAKPDLRFFEYSASLAKNFRKTSSVVIGDRLETDILGAHHFEVASCWYNPHRTEAPLNLKPTHEVTHLSEIINLLK